MQQPRASLATRQLWRSLWSRGDVVEVAGGGGWGFCGIPPVPQTTRHGWGTWRLAPGLEWRRLAGSEEKWLTFFLNPLLFGCGLSGHNLCRLIGSDSAGDDRATCPWACLGAWLSGAVSTLAADDFKTYCVSGASADCDEDQARAGEYLHTKAEGDQDSERLGNQLSPVLGREFRQAGCGGQSNEERGGQR